MRGTLALVVLGLVGSGCGNDTPSTPVDDGGADAHVDASADATPDTAPPNDAATPDSGPTCKVLNVAILGNPGQNPSSNFVTWLQKAGATATRMQTTSTVTLAAQDIAPFDVIVLDQLPRPYSAQEAAVVKAFVENGGGLISMTGYIGTASDFRANMFISELGVTYGGSIVNGPVSVTNFAAHPITTGLGSITFATGYIVSAPGSSANVRTVIASIPAGNVGYAVEASKGRAFIWGDEYIEFDSVWSSLPDVKALWVNVFSWLAPKGCALKPQ